MRTQSSRSRAQQARHLENLMAQLAKGREWATPGVHAALERAVTGLDTGIESASPRIQAMVRRLAEELAGGVEAATPRIHQGLQRVVPKAAPLAVAPEPARSGRKAWVVAAALAVAASLGVAAWRIARTREAIAPDVVVQDASGGNPEDDPENAAARI
ncbi:MAG: hypothetical protein ABWX68_09725 [Arthrobacter sp.]|uniref:hypothetical protein n=1 Tax=Arthrobacter sp. TaxID=1667 RepID=UPI00346A861E